MALVRRVVYVTELQDEWLEQRAEELGISAQEFLRGELQRAKDHDDRRRRKHGLPPLPLVPSRPAAGEAPE